MHLIYSSDVKKIVSPLKTVSYDHDVTFCIFHSTQKRLSFFVKSEISIITDPFQIRNFLITVLSRRAKALTPIPVTQFSVTRMGFLNGLGDKFSDKSGPNI